MKVVSRQGECAGKACLESHWLDIARLRGSEREVGALPGTVEVGGEAVGLHAAMLMVATVCGVTAGHVPFCLMVVTSLLLEWLHVVLHADAPIPMVMMGEHRHDRQQHAKQQQQVAGEEVAAQAYHVMEGIYCFTLLRSSISVMGLTSTWLAPTSMAFSRSELKA